MSLLVSTCLGCLYFCSVLILLRVAIGWLPNVNWYEQPFYFVIKMTDPCLKPFRFVTVRFGWIDLSPVLAIIIIQYLIQVLSSIGIRVDNH